MRNSYHPHWTNIKDASDEEVAKRIDTSVKSIADFKPTYQKLQQLRLDTKKPLKILDFGAGLLRNTVGLLNLGRNWSVVAYDNPEMLARGTKLFDSALQRHDGRWRVESDWDRIKGENFDLAIAFLVLQHIKDHEIRAYLLSLENTVPYLAVQGRRSLDGGKGEVWPIVADHYEVVETFGVDPAEFGRGKGGAEDHHMVIFRSKKFADKETVLPFRV